MWRLYFKDPRNIYGDVVIELEDKFPIDDVVEIVNKKRFVLYKVEEVLGIDWGKDKKKDDKEKGMWIVIGGVRGERVALFFWFETVEEAYKYAKEKHKSSPHFRILVAKVELIYEPKRDDEDEDDGEGDNETRN